jgi:enoyl-CoA hydratase/carnithine racemase
METEKLEISTRGAARIIRINRPEKRNALTFEMMKGIAEAVESADEDPAVRSTVITGGDTMFSSGGDLREALDLRAPAEVRRALDSWQGMNGAIERAAKPVIAAIEGSCLTGGCELALACDVRIAGEGATFGITSSKIGTVPGAGGTQRLPRAVGMANALYLMLSADPVGASEAWRIGLVNVVVPAGQALSKALALAETFEQRAPMSLALIKRAVRDGLEANLSTGLELEHALVALAYSTDDRREGVAAFLEKRTPAFKGR